MSQATHHPLQLYNNQNPIFHSNAQQLPHSYAQASYASSQPQLNQHLGHSQMHGYPVSTNYNNYRTQFPSFTNSHPVYNPVYPHINGLQQPGKAQKRITYLPYERTYTDYEDQVILVPVEKVRTNYYQKIYETQYEPRAIESVTEEVVAVEKEENVLQYVPVEQKIIHLPHGQIYGEKRQNATYSNQVVTNMMAQNNQNTIIENRPPIITQNQQIIKNSQNQQIIQNSTSNNKAINNQRIFHQSNQIQNPQTHQIQNTQFHQTNHIISRSQNPQIKINGIVISSHNQNVVTKQQTINEVESNLENTKKLDESLVRQVEDKVQINEDQVPKEQ